jgi:MerR family transcriptional regulator, copper efflux regulator
MSVELVMNIGQASKASGVSAKMIRYYESIRLIPPPARSESNYRHYTPNDVYTLSFVRRGRDLGFSIEEITRLLDLWRDRSRASADVKRVALDHVATLKDKIVELQGMVATLEHLADHCRGDARPECPIMDDLSGETRSPPSPEKPLDHTKLARPQRRAMS